jgi:REP element-mobilizing transposase RayT
VPQGDARRVDTLNARNRVPGGTFFFTVNLLDRRSDLLVTHVDALRAAVRKAQSRSPFHIDAWVVLPDHMHCLWTLPEPVICFGVLKAGKPFDAAIAMAA